MTELYLYTLGTYYPAPIPQSSSLLAPNALCSPSFVPSFKLCNYLYAKKLSLQYLVFTDNITKGFYYVNNLFGIESVDLLLLSSIYLKVRKLKYFNNLAKN
jgi:hypothetical protein